MKHRIASIFTALTMSVSVLPMGALADENNSPLGSEDNPYLISTAEELADFAVAVDNGRNYFGEYIKLTNDIDLSNICGEDIDGVEVSWNPIGTQQKRFMGTFDGDGYTISGLYYIYNINDNRQGLFEQLDGATI